MIRKITSFVMLYSFIIMVVSGVMLFISPFGRLSMMIKWEMMGLGKMDFQALHLIFMLLFTIAGIVHIIYNIKPIKNYLKNRARKVIVFTKEFVISTVIIIGLFIATINHIEPLETFVKMNKSFNNYWIEEFKKERTRKMRNMMENR